MTKDKITEEEIAAVAKVIFEAQGYDMYPECQIPCFGGRPDYIGVKGNSWCAAIECKVTFSYDVLAQVIRWHMEKDYCEKSDFFQNNPDPERIAIPNFLYVITSNSKGGKIHDLKKFLLDKYRIGWYDIEVDRTYPDDYEFSERELRRVPDSKLSKYSNEEYGSVRIGSRVYSYRCVSKAGIQEGSRRTSHSIIAQLYPEMKQATSGTTGSKTNYMTPFKLTLQTTYNLMQEGKEYHPQTLCEMINSNGGHHYSKDSTYKSSIGGWLVKKNLAEKVSEYPPRYRKVINEEEN